MLLSKFFASVINRSPKHNFGKLKTCFFSTRCSTEKGKLCSKQYDTIQPFSRSRCKKNKEAATKSPGEKCPKKIECPDRSSASGCPDAPSNAAEVYKRAFADVRRDALNLQIFTRNSVNALTSSMIAELMGLADSERSRMQGLLSEMDAKVHEITDLSLTCGSKKQQEKYAIAENITSRLQTWKCENAGGLQYMKHRLDQIECRVKERTDTAVEIVRTCKGCLTAQGLITCSKAAAQDSACILKLTEEELRKELAELEKFKVRYLNDSEVVIQKLMSDFEAQVKEYNGHLGFIVKELKKLNKKC